MGAKRRISDMNEGLALRLLHASPNDRKLIGNCLLLLRRPVLDTGPRFSS
jgi:hypothetical protein